MGDCRDALFSFIFCMIDCVTNWMIKAATFQSFPWQDFFKYNYEHNMNLFTNLQFLSPVEETMGQL